MQAATRSRRKREIHAAELIIIAAVTLLLGGIDVTFYFWPFRYREVHPLLQQIFRSRIDVKSYHRTYFPHPGFIAEDITMYRHGDTHIPVLATIQRMRVEGTWSGLFLHPHQLYQMRLEGVRVQIPPPGTRARRMDFDQGVIDTSGQKMEIETIIADGTTLDFLQHGSPPLRFTFPALQVHNVQARQPMQFYAEARVPVVHGSLFANGSLGPFQTTNYNATPILGTWSLENSDLSCIDGISGHAAASGNFSGKFSAMDVVGKAAIPDFRAGSGHTVRMDAAYHITISGPTGNVIIRDAQVTSGSSVISASGSVTGTPKKVAVTIATKDSRVQDLLQIIEEDSPQVAGNISFQAAVEFNQGPEKFLQRLHLKGEASLTRMRFARPDTRQAVDAFSARVRKDPSGNSPPDPTDVAAQAWSQTTFDHGMAFFPDIHVSIPGAQARLHGTFNLLDTSIHLIGKVALQQNISHAVTGWKSWLLKPLIPFFAHEGAGAVVSIAVTGTAAQPKIGQNILHNK